MQVISKTHSVTCIEILNDILCEIYLSVSNSIKKIQSYRYFLYRNRFIKSIHLFITPLKCILIAKSFFHPRKCNINVRTFHTYGKIKLNVIFFLMLKEISPVMGHLNTFI